ncbi:MAG: twin-arginine translocase TatA/TatE family subunit [Planctomycetia bacterium]
MDNLTHVLLAGLPGGMEWWIILLVILLLFGSRLPGVARSLGQGINEFKKGLKGDEAAAQDKAAASAAPPKTDAK